MSESGVISSVLRNLRGMEAKSDNELHLQQRLINLLEKYTNQPMNPNYRKDMLIILSEVIELINTMGSRNYSIDEVTLRISSVLSGMEKILSHVSTSRPRIGMFGILVNGQLIPMTFTTVVSAQEYQKFLSQYSEMETIIVKVDVSCASAAQPVVAAPNQKGVSENRIATQHQNPPHNVELPPAAPPSQRSANQPHPPPEQTEQINLSNEYYTEHGDDQLEALSKALEGLPPEYRR